MLKKRIDTYSILIFSVLCIILGFFITFNGELILRYNIYLVAVILFLITVYDFLKLLAKRDKKQIIECLTRMFVDYIFTVIVLYNTDVLIAGFGVVFGIYILLHSILHLFNFFLYKNNHIKGQLKLLIFFVIYFVLAILLILSPIENMFFAEVIIGLYFIFFGISKLNDFLVEILPIKFTNSIKAHIQIQLPIFMAMFIPKQLITLINETLEINDNDDSFDVSKQNKTPDIEVIVHLANSGSAAFGHVEICFENKIYSFGNYDKHSRKIFDSIGDGVICIADRNPYIKYVIEKKDRYLVVFGLQLTEDEIKLVRKRIYNLININTINYHSDLELVEQGFLKTNDINDMTSDIYKLANGKFKKIIKGKNKKFFVLKTNCVMVASSILNGIGKNLVAINGIISPGSYYDYLNSEFLKKNSKVITRKVYTQKNIPKIN